MRFVTFALAAAGLGCHAMAGAPFLMVVESTNDRVMLFDAFDGSLVNNNFIDMLADVAADPGTPINALQIGNEVWISDQIRDRVMRYSGDGTTFLGHITGGMDNIRGMEYVASQNTVYVSNSGTGNGAPGDSLITIDASTASITGSFAVGDPFDALDYNGALLVSNISGDTLHRYAYDGTDMGIFHDSDGITGIDFPQQMALASSGGVWAAGFSSPSGVYQYDSSGAQVAYFDVGQRGVWELGNGNVMYTDGTGVHILDPMTGMSSSVVTGVAGRFISGYIPGPGPVGLLALAGIAATRRRR